MKYTFLFASNFVIYISKKVHQFSQVSLSGKICLNEVNVRFLHILLHSVFRCTHVRFILIHPEANMIQAISIRGLVSSTHKNTYNTVQKTGMSTREENRVGAPGGHYCIIRIHLWRIQIPSDTFPFPALYSLLLFSFGQRRSESNHCNPRLSPPGTTDMGRAGVPLHKGLTLNLHTEFLTCKGGESPLYEASI